MGVDVAIETEDGERLETVFDPKNHFAHVLCLPGLESTVCLRFIDRYGDTVFNQLQILVFISELEALRGRVTDDALRAEALRRLEDARRAGWAPAILRAHEADVADVSARPVRDHLEAVLLVTRKAAAQVHTYLKCYGD